MSVGPAHPLASGPGRRACTAKASTSAIRLTLFDYHQGWWGEGDERVYVDGEEFPSHLGTGTEDYDGYAHCLNVPFSTPFVTQPNGTGNLTAGFTVNSRFRLLDRMPFQESLQLDMELSDGQKTKMDDAPATYGCGRPGVTSNIEPDFDNATRPVTLTVDQSPSTSGS